MDADIELYFSRSLFGKPRIVIREPSHLKETPPGTFGDLPSQWLSADRLIASVDVLDQWTRDTVGQDIVRAINQHAQQQGARLTRVFISSDEKLRGKTLPAPWELLEHTPAALRSAPLAVVRLFDGNVAAGGASDTVTRLRLLALFADPDGNIEEMDTHIEALCNFAAENDEKLEAKILYFDNAESVRQQCAGFDPHAVYFIGHGTQDGSDQVRLQIGPRDQGTRIDLSSFADLLQQTGAPRLVILNACESFAGGTLDPYLGAALRLSPRFDYVVSMQLKEPIPAATAFAAALLGALARGNGLAAAMTAGRTAMAARADPDFGVTPYIPVLVQRTRQDVPYSIDAGEQERLRLQKLMASRLELIEHLPRAAEAKIRGTLQGTGTHAVSLLTGPPECGKSTALRAVLAMLITPAEIKNGSRFLYFSAKDVAPIGNSTTGVSQLLQAFARDCAPFTDSLNKSLATAAARNTHSALAAFATWLDEKKAAGYRFVIVFDDLPSDLAADIASRAPVVTSGHVMLVTDDPVPGSFLVERITLGPMTAQEIAAAFPELDGTRVQQIALETGGIPLLVSAAARGEHVQATALYDALALSPEQLHIVRVVALSERPMPSEVIAELGIADVVKELVTPLLFNTTTDGALMVPVRIRDITLAELTAAEETADRRLVAAAYERVAYRERTGGFRRARIIRLYKEALQQRVRMLQLSVDSEIEETLDAARADMFDLDYELLEEGDETAEAKLLWELYRGAAVQFGDDRESDARYARCLQRNGQLEEADEILGALTSDPYEDDLQILILLERDELLHDLGGNRETRLALLKRAREIHEKLRDSGNVRVRTLAEREAEIEQAFGNAYGYGEGATPEEAIRHLARAVEIFENLRDHRAETAYAEKIEIARYNNLLSDAERAEGIEKIQKSVQTLLARSVKKEAINRLYALGRLATDFREKAKWFRAAYEEAGDGYAPIRWHAAVHWKCSEAQANETPFLAAAPQILAYCRELEAWQEQAWSRRVLRNAFRFLAAGYAAAGDVEQQRHFLGRCREVISRIEKQRDGERRGDRRIRLEVDEEIRRAFDSAPEGAKP